MPWFFNSFLITLLDPPVNVVEQDVDQDSGDGHVKPGGVDPTSQTSVVLKTFHMDQIEESEDAWNDQNRQGHVGKQHSQVEH